MCYVRVVPLKIKKGITTTKAFQETLDKFGRKPNKIWVDKVNEFYNRSMKLWLQDNDIEMYSTHNEGGICCCSKIYYDLKEPNLKIYEFNVKKFVS